MNNNFLFIFLTSALTEKERVYSRERKEWWDKGICLPFVPPFLSFSWWWHSVDLLVSYISNCTVQKSHHVRCADTRALAVWYGRTSMRVVSVESYTFILDGVNSHRRVPKPDEPWSWPSSSRFILFVPSLAMAFEGLLVTGSPAVIWFSVLPSWAHTFVEISAPCKLGTGMWASARC